MSQFANPAAGARDAARAYTAALLDLLGERDPLEVMRDTPPALRRAVGGLSAAQLNAAEAPGKWSMAQVLQHLADSELVGSFRFRMILAEDRPAIPAYDQDRWVARLHTHETGVEEDLEEFAVLRRGNLRLFGRLGPEDLARVGMHAERGEESLEHLLRLYAAHDLVHLRQLARIRATVEPAPRGA